ncbi:MAG: inorganic phosphate transporter [Roseofilum sp. SBFL]|uniref:inorganic phosphate transporter n=1 Tax=unclassified Roseofilum TaxID=2620099 RepID=UPI001B04B810|nr:MULTISPECIES: inorganic phosphate transporter [unclassified Roseofilum]MBP0015092.1 inorganic phosphate transporter [Roseofilum sp. SID3]MBP0024296.1 inorganic phosphate transporter [Roseofilum sp. SID2]MBP0036533.1 inorganic phosphate transporter [Roseofilum sp. SID1]MBP0041534.1 inorganic phosphate transporter [Roseofilum sp. SBFL]
MDLLLPVLLAFYVACNLGANDVANSMGTSVGSKAITLTQAVLIAGILEFTGAVWFGSRVSETLATDLIHLEEFAPDLQLLFLGMVSVLLTCGLWLQIATRFGLPVASSHAIIGAIAGFSGVAIGPEAMDWSTLGRISLVWVITPVVSGSLAMVFYHRLKAGILDHPQSQLRLQEWIPWICTGLFSIFGAIVLPTLFANFSIPHLPNHTAMIGTAALGTLGLTALSWHQFSSEKPLEGLFAQFQVISACFVAFAHGSNDVGNAIAPLAVISQIRQGDMLMPGNFQVPLWSLIVGAIGIVFGLAIWGKNVISTVGENITPLKPSGGFCAEVATATTILLASRFGFPVSTSHALVGAVVGIGLVQRSPSSPLKFKTLREIGLVWAITLPLTASISATILAIVRLFWA